MQEMQRKRGINKNVYTLKIYEFIGLRKKKRMNTQKKVIWVKIFLVYESSSFTFNQKEITQTQKRRKRFEGEQQRARINF